MMPFCSKCGNIMQVLLDTYVCPNCDSDTIYELGFVKYDLEELNK